MRRRHNPAHTVAPLGTTRQMGSLIGILDLSLRSSLRLTEGKAYGLNPTLCHRGALS